MVKMRRILGAGLAGMLTVAPVCASELSYTFLDFLYLDQNVDVAGTQQPVPDQTVDVVSDTANGIGIAGSLGLGDRFFVAGAYKSSIVDFTGTISNPLTEITIDDNYDLIVSQLSFGYLRPIGDDLDIVFELTHDSVEYDFGSLAGENFDTNDSGVGASVGFRWNPTRSIEVFGFARYTPVGTVSLDRREFESDTIGKVGLIWYFFEDLGLGLDYETGQLESVRVSMRFSFGNLQW